MLVVIWPIGKKQKKQEQPTHNNHITRISADPGVASTSFPKPAGLGFVWCAHSLRIDIAPQPPNPSQRKIL